jgi:hypothetical protein
MLGTVFIIYMLAEGLAFRLWRTNVISHKTFASVYAPIFYFDRHCAWFSNLEEDYENLWYNQEKEFVDAVNRGLDKDGVITTYVSNPPQTFFTLQDFFDFGMATVVAVGGASLIYFPQWAYRVVSPEQVARDRKRVRIVGHMILTFGIILLVFKCHDLLVHGF